MCPQCGEFVGQSGFVIVYGHATDEEGNWIEGSEVTIGLFHPNCWEQWKAEHPLPDDDASTPPGVIRASGGESGPFRRLSRLEDLQVTRLRRELVAATHDAS